MTVTQDEIDSAWSLRLMQGIAASLPLFITPPVAIAYLFMNRVCNMFYGHLPQILCASASNIGANSCTQKKFDFALGFKIETTAKLVSVTTTSPSLIGFVTTVRLCWALFQGN